MNGYEIAVIIVACSIALSLASMAASWCINLHVNTWYETESNMELRELMNDVYKWSIETFGVDRAPAKLSHLGEEVKEAIDSPRGDHSEFADILLLTLDAAASAGLTAQDLINQTRDKLEVCKSREWEEGEDGVYHHKE